ncbi:aminotransferase class III-fold pyridoxal phosphate-dependent enzyme [Candidatus Micrarchaeota archaeon]|nr:aminotransferase class III-fold pyridoxal phosphate-dependent enzyme [Candidatus Micrarchaeota archaeon]
MITVILQARMSSTRLPGKTLSHILGKPMLWHVIQRLKKSKKANKLVVATTINRTDDPIEQLCKTENIVCFRGSENDVLDRYVQAIRTFGGDVVVRVTADCPLLDADVMDLVIDDFLKGGADFVSNIFPPTYPDGLDVEVCSRSTLEKAHKEAKLSSEREHVMPYIWKNKDIFTQRNVTNPDGDFSKMRWTVDTPEDLEFVRAVYESLGSKGQTHDFTTKDILEIIRDSDISKINSKYTRNEGYAKSVKEDGVFMNSGQELWKKAKKLIPGGSQLLSKRSEMFLPDQWPSYYSRAKGIELWGLNNEKYTDMCIMGIGACILGYADDDVNKAVKQRIDNANMATLNCPEEVELAEKLLSLTPWAGMVRYTRTGGETMSVAVRIARAYAKKDKVAMCGYHGWHDWYLATNLKDPNGLNDHLLKGLEPRGVPSTLQGTTLPFHYNKIEELEALVDKNKDIGVIVVEAIRSQKPENNFLQRVRKIADEIGAVLIFDEITSAWRTTVGGAHLSLGVTPDIVAFGKAMSNGYAMGAVVGKSEVMDTAQSSFISSTYWTEGIGPTAALATIRKLEEKKVPQHVTKLGQKMGEIWQKAGAESGVKVKVDFGFLPIMHFDFEYGDQNQVLATLFTQEMLRRGYLASRGFYVSYAHTPESLDRYAQAASEVFASIKKGIDEGNVEKMLKGPVAHKGFQRLTN